MFFDAFFILPDGLSYVQHRVGVRPGRTSPVTPKSRFCAPQLTRDFQVTALTRLRRSGSFGNVANQFHDAAAFRTAHDASLALLGRFRAGRVSRFCRDGLEVQQLFDFLQTLPMRRRQKAVVAHFDEAVRQNVLQEATDKFFRRDRPGFKLLGLAIAILKRDVAIFQFQ